MNKSLEIPGLGNTHAVVVMEGELSEGFFEPLAATVTGASGGGLRCGLPEGVRIPDWAIDTTQEPFDLSKAEAATAVADSHDSPKRKLRAQLLDSVRRLESVRVSWDAVVPKGLPVQEEPASEAALAAECEVQTAQAQPHRISWARLHKRALHRNAALPELRQFLLILSGVKQALVTK